jgi:hypothetical protein
MRVLGLRRWVGVAVLVCGLAAWGQSYTPVTVTVMEPTGLFVPRAVVAFSQSTNTSVTKSETDERGQATAELVPGSYDLTVEAAGFERTRESVSLASAMDIPVMLKLGETCPPCQREIRAVAEELPTEVPVFSWMIQSAAAAPASAPGYTPVTVTVNGPDGAAVAGAEIRVTPGSPAGDKLITDEHGQVKLGMPAGEYKLEVSAQGFASADQTVTVADKAQTVTVALTAATAANAGTEGSGPAPMQPGAVPLESTVESAAHPAGAATPPAATVLTVIGAGGLRGIFTPQTLGQYPQTTVTVFDPHAKKQVRYAGVPLMDLLVKLGVAHGKDLMGKALAQYVVATGSDGYVSVVALGEVDVEFHPGTVLVADAMDGKPLDAKTGPFRLVVTEDKRPARSVRNLVKVEVRTAE